MSAKNIRIISILQGVAILFIGLKVKRNWLKTLLFAFGAFQVVGNLLANNQVYEDLEAQIKEQMNKGKEQL